MRYAVALPLCAAAVLAGCAQKNQAPTDTGVCYQALFTPKGDVARFNKIADNIPSIELCAKTLEEARERFLRMGGTHHTLAGAYQGQFLFISPRVIEVSQTVDGMRYPLFLHQGNQLVAPGAAQPQDQ